MSSKSIYQFDRLNESLSNIFNIEYSSDYSSIEDTWSTMETLGSIPHPLFSQSYRDSLILETKQVCRKLRSNKKDTTLIQAESLLKELNKQIGYLSNRYKENHDENVMIQIRKLRKSKTILLKNK
jgi:hypothetical protein